MNPEPQTPLCREGDDVAILFARTPVPGRVKSRLLTHLTPEQACALHVASTLDTAELIGRSALAARWIFWSEALRSENGRSADGSEPPLQLPASFRTAVQQGETLGDRMANAFAQALAGSARRVVIFGSDSPTLPAAYIAQAFAALSEHDLVLGPAEDGGYYLIGCRRFDPAVFEGVRWSTSEVLRQTCANAEHLGFKVRLLEPWYDLDQWKDVERMLAESQTGPPLPLHLAAFFNQLIQEKGEDASS